MEIVFLHNFHNYHDSEFKLLKEKYLLAFLLQREEINWITGDLKVC